MYSLISSAQSNKSIVYRGEQLKNLMLSEQVAMSNLYDQPENFPLLRKLGIIKEKQCEKSPVDETCIFTFHNMKITFINLNGEFELSEIVIFRKGSALKINNENILIDSENISEKREKGSSSIFKEFKNSNGMTEKQKFEAGYSYLEIFLGENDNIEKIKYRRLLL